MHCTTCISRDLCITEGRCYKMEPNKFPRKTATPLSGDMQAIAAAIDASRTPVDHFMPPGPKRALRAWALRSNPTVEENARKAPGLWVGAGRSERSYSFFDRVKPKAVVLDWAGARVGYRLPDNFDPAHWPPVTRSFGCVVRPITMPNTDAYDAGELPITMEPSAADDNAERQQRAVMINRGWTTPEDTKEIKKNVIAALEAPTSHCGIYLGRILELLRG